MQAYINHGRWVADCTNCNGGIKANADHVTCPDCAFEFDLVFSSARDEAERILAYRPLANQNWHPDVECIEDLKAENALRGLPF
jgi:predicted RNA-binding Zn-ribbon protein involved in translation (DUF1610 family)